MKKTMGYVVSGVMLVVAQAALADVPEKASKVLEHVPSGVYVEGTLGYSSTGAGFANEYQYNETNASPRTFKTNLSNGGLGYNVSLGYQFMNNIGIELGATSYASREGSIDMGHYDHVHSNIGSVETTDAHMYDLAGRFSLPIDEKFDVFAKLGLAYLEREGSFTESATQHADSFSDHGLGILYGVGFDYNFTQHLAWTTQATAATPFSYFGSQGHTIEDTTVPSMFLVSTGVKYTF